MQSVAAEKFADNSEGFNGEGQSNSVYKIPFRFGLIQKILLAALVCVGWGTSSLIFGADTSTADASAKWKFSTEVRMDASSRNFAEMTKLEIMRANELANRSLLQEHVYSDERLLFIRLRFDSYDQSVAFPKLSHFQFGYGDIFPADTVLRTSANGAGWEEPNVAYIKFCKSF